MIASTPTCPAEACMANRSVLQWDRRLRGNRFSQTPGLGMLFRTALRQLSGLHRLAGADSVPRYEMLRRAPTPSACFRWSPGPDGHLPRLAEEILRLAVEVALIANPDGSPPLHSPHNKLEKSDCDHPSMEAALKRRWEFSFQEQLMQLAVDCAGSRPPRPTSCAGLWIKRSTEKKCVSCDRFFPGLRDWRHHR